MTIHCIQHAEFESPGLIADWAAERGHSLEMIHLWKGDLLPHPSDVTHLLVLGGPMSANDEDTIPFLRAELHFLLRYVQRGHPVLGICLGAQLLARVHGARVYANKQKEIGWFDVKCTEDAAKWLPKDFTPFHWHGDTFDLPAGATLLASSSRCMNQAFAIGEKQVGLQFHPEANEALVKAMIEHGQHELINIPGIQTAEEMLLQIERKTESNKVVLFPLLDSVFS